jgi:radical SAM superfamily enzyme YgiQ (UPF0313 family)
VRVLLVNPRYELSFWSLTGAAPVTGRRGFMPPLALATLAALAPSHVDVRIVDESVEPIDFDAPCDVVGITGYVTQRARIIEIAAEFRRRGVLVAIGGPYASLSPDTLRPHADVLFRGEAELTWPAFLDDLCAGSWLDEYHQHGNVDITGSPPPAVGTLHNDRYFMGTVQTSRGCPFECEFCDVIVYLGRRQRYKGADQVVREVQAFHDTGQRQVFLADDNLTAHRGRAAETLRALSEWNSDQSERIAFNTQVSIDVAREGDEPLLDLCAEAGLTTAFVGIETPDTGALLEVNKHQNVRYDLLTHVRRFHEHGISVQAGMIVGFDSDTTDIFRRQYEFAQEAGTAMISLGTLNAPEGTPLERRLLAQGRLDPAPVADVYSSTNIVPLQLTSDELRTGTTWLMNRLYAPTGFMERISVVASQLPSGSSRRPAGREGAALWDRLQRAYRMLGPEFEHLPRQGAELFRGKDLTHLATALIFYLHVVRMLRHWGVWDDTVAGRPAPFC